MTTETFDVCVAGAAVRGWPPPSPRPGWAHGLSSWSVHGSLGGMASAALVHSVCGLYKLPGKGAPAALANDGFAAEFAGRLLTSGHAHGPVPHGAGWMCSCTVRQPLPTWPIP